MVTLCRVSCDCVDMMDILHYVAPKFRFVAELLKISNAVKSVLCSGESYAHSVVDPEEANGSFFVAANQGQKNDVTFFSLLMNRIAYFFSSQDYFSYVTNLIIIHS